MLTDGDRSAVDDYPWTPVGLLHDSDGLLLGRIDPVAFPVYPLENRDGPHADPGGRLVKHGDRSAGLGGRAQDFVGLVALTVGHDGGLLRLAVCPGDQLGCRDCLAERRGGLHEGPADSVADPTDLVPRLEGLGLHLLP